MFRQAGDAPGREHIDERNLPNEIFVGQAEIAALDRRQFKNWHRFAD